MKKTLNEMKKALASYVSLDVERANAWRKVTLNKKKNGEDFAQINKSFTNAKVGDYYPVEGWFNPYITVNFTYITEDGKTEYSSDHMEIYTEEFAEHRERRQSPYSSNYSHYILTPDEIMGKIAERIATFEKMAEQHTKELNNAEEMYNTYILQIESLMKEMKEKANGLRDENSPYNTSIYYVLKECAESVVSSAY